MSALTAVRTLRWSSVAAYRDFRAIYTAKSWVFGWLLRCFSQVAVFGLLGTVVGEDDAALFLVVGTAFLSGLNSVALVIQSVAWERQTGTLPLLLASPASPFVVFAGRGIQWLVDGMVVCLLSLALVPALFGQPVPPARLVAAVPVVVLTYGAMYAFSLVLAAVILDLPQARNLTSNLTVAVVALVTGVQVPLAFWPDWVQSLALVLPLTHGLVVLRTLIGEGTWDVGALVAQVVTLVAWFLVAVVTFRGFVRRARRSGTTDFAE